MSDVKYNWILISSYDITSKSNYTYNKNKDRGPSKDNLDTGFIKLLNKEFLEANKLLED